MFFSCQEQNINITYSAVSATRKRKFCNSTISNFKIINQNQDETILNMLKILNYLQANFIIWDSSKTS